VLAADFADVDAAGHTLRVREIEAFTAVASDTGMSVSYALEDVKLTEGEPQDPDGGVEVEQTAFFVGVDSAGTPDDPSDDTYTVDGGGQVASDGGIWQVAVGQTVLSPDCRENPTSGFATIQDVSVATGGDTGWLFHATCDGNAEVAASVGRGSAWSGRALAFPLVE
jgi:hypothetical protein